MTETPERWADLQHSPPDWGAVSPPPGWEGVATICRRVADDLESLVDTIVECIDSEIPDYRESAGALPEDLRQSVRRNIEMMLLAIAERRDPTALELEVRRELGRRRASQGVPVDSVLQAYHVGYREVWAALVRVTTVEHPEAAGLLAAATTVWNWIHLVTHAVAEAHRETARGQESLALAVGQRFFDFLASGDLSSELADAARFLGFDPELEFQVVCVREPTRPADVGRLQAAIGRRTGGAFRCVPRGRDLVVVGQATSPDAVVSTVHELMPAAAIGVGLPRSGLAGARLSLGDAERALALSVRRGGTSRFQDDWLESTLLQEWERLGPLLDPTLDVIARNPHLADTVRAFAKTGFSVADTARQLCVHPNTVAYRLERWRKLTGWNPRSYPGLAASVASMELGRAVGPAAHDWPA